MSSKEALQSVTVPWTVALTTSYDGATPILSSDKDIYIPFPVDEVRLKKILFHSDCVVSPASVELLEIITSIDFTTTLFDGITFLGTYSPIECGKQRAGTNNNSSFYNESHNGGVDDLRWIFAGTSRKTISGRYNITAKPSSVFFKRCDACFFFEFIQYAPPPLYQKVGQDYKPIPGEVYLPKVQYDGSVTMEKSLVKKKKKRDRETSE